MKKRKGERREEAATWPASSKNLSFYHFRFPLLFSMEIRDAEDILNLLDSCISRVKWPLRSSAKRRLATDVLALCTGMRAVVMVDYGGKMPELQDNLCTLISLLRKECTMLVPLRVMVIEDMIYMVHVEGIEELTNPSLQQQIHFVDLEVDPPQLILQTNPNVCLSEFLSVQRSFSSVFASETVVDTVHAATPLSMVPKVGQSEYRTAYVACTTNPTASQPCEIVDMTNCLKDTEITIPGLNGWLLGYPVLYLFRKEHAAEAVYNLTTKYLHIYKIIICRHQTPSRKPCEEELMSFSVPYALSIRRDKESWAEAFFSHLLAKFETCKQIWLSIRLEVTECHPHAIAL